MPLWGRNDQAVTANSTTTAASTTGAPIGTAALVKGGGGANAHFGNTSAGSRAAADVALFGNTTADAFIPGMKVGVFGVSASEMGVAAGNLSSASIISGGCGYTANATVTLTFANGSTNATAITSMANVSTGGQGGKITELTIAENDGTWTESPTVTLSAPTAMDISANTTGVGAETENNIVANTSGVSNTEDVLLLASANTTYMAGDRLYYKVPAANTAITGLTGNSIYYVTFSNSTALAVSNTLGGSNANIAETIVGDGEVHTIRKLLGVIALANANTKLQVNDRVYYGVPAANTPINGLTGNTYYYVSYSNGSTIGLTSTIGGSNIAVYETRIDAAEVHTLTGQTASASVVINTEALKGAAHAGWVLRKEGTGGRAGRVTYEVLVAMGSLGAQTAGYGTPADPADASDDATIPD